MGCQILRGGGNFGFGFEIQRLALGTVITKGPRYPTQAECAQQFRLPRSIFAKYDTLATLGKVPESKKGVSENRDPNIVP